LKNEIKKHQEVADNLKKTRFKSGEWVTDHVIKFIYMSLQFQIVLMYTYAIIFIIVSKITHKLHIASRAATPALPFPH
jgi:hypothetical protein